MTRCFLAFFYIVCAFAANAADGGNGGNSSDGGNGTDGTNTVSTPGRAGCPGGTNPDRLGKFYLPGTKEQCNPGKQDVIKRSQ